MYFLLGRDAYGTYIKLNKSCWRKLGSNWIPDCVDFETKLRAL